LLTPARAGYMSARGVAEVAGKRGGFVVRRREEWRQVGLVAAYDALLLLPLFQPAWRHPVVWLAACYLSFVNAIVIHNSLHQGVFESKGLNMWWRRVLSFGALYPASANIPSHNLVHHQFDDDGQPDWAEPNQVRFRWNLLNLIHFPNLAGPATFAGVQRWIAVTRHPGFDFQYKSELVFAFGLTGLCMLHDFWATLLFIVLPQLWGARCILRINLIQHDRTDIASEWNHSRNFVGGFLNWVICNNGYHTIHHNRAGLHWSDLPEAHRREVQPRIDPSLDEPSMVGYLARSYVLRFGRPSPRDVAAAEQAAPVSDLVERSERRRQAEATSLAESANA
jgi:beta-carotene hydroxylase